MFPFSRRLRIESLEDRRLLATITVNTLIDESDGSIVDGDVSLRDAVNLAAANDTINFSVTGTINLGNSGVLLVAKDLTINGPGANLLTINAFDPTPSTNNGDGNRVFNISDNTGIVRFVSISGLTITGADTSGSGGGVRNQENLNITACTISGNSAASQGGGVYSSGTLAVTNSTITGNTAAFGGGILGRYSSVSISGTTVSNNQAPNSVGGGIEIVFGTLNVSNSTISGNRTATGGGIMSYHSTTTLVSSTISGNEADQIGGGIMKYYGALNIFHSTITENEAVVQGGGIQSLGSATQLDHTLVAENLAQGHGDITGSVAARFSLIGTNVGATITDNGGNLIGIDGSPIDPRLYPLGNNGGMTFTHALRPDSPALEAGDPAAVGGIGNVPLSDQRGGPFIRVFDNDGVGGARIDIGAYERQSVPGLSLMVDTLVDENDTNYGPGDFSLREAVGLANGSVGPNTITFAPSLLGTILITQGELQIRDHVAINGPGALGLAIDASGSDPTPNVNEGNGSRVFRFDDGVFSTRFNATLNGLTITGGDVLSQLGFDSGGGIKNLENLAIVNCVISGNSAGTGGGITSGQGGSLNVTGSTISGNAASLSGGGIVGSDVVTITDSIVSGNSAGETGGGIHVTKANFTLTGSTISGNVTASGGGILSHFSTTTIVSSTISGNRATSEGGGIRKYYGTLNIFHSTITGNRANSQGAGIQSLGSATVLDHTIVAPNIMGVGFTGEQDILGAAAARFSLIGSNFGATITDNGGNLIGTPTSLIDPMLESLANNGGSTWTHALKPGSPALEAGDPAAVAGSGSVPLRDQRGAPFVRVFDNDGVGGARIDIGAFERQTLPAGQSLVVDTLVDEIDQNYGPGDLSLREAINLANGSVGVNTITFAPSLANGTILLTQGELLIRDEVAINGFLTQLLTIDASGNDPTPILNDGNGSRVFNIDNGNLTADFTVSLSDLTITGADQGLGEFGGGIRSEEHLTLTNCIVFNNASSGRGGGIFADGNLTVTNCLISANHTGTDGGGIRSSGDTTTISGSQISGNSAVGDGGGVRVGSATITITSSTISGNTAGGDGGGMRSAAGNGTVTVTGCNISNNTATGFGGGIDDRSSGELIVTKSTISGNTGANGGGIANHDGLLTVTSSTVSGNTAPSQGGGIYNTVGQLSLVASTVSGNTGGFGGGMLGRNGSIEVINSTISSNNAPNSNGGGIEAVFTTLSVSNSTLSGNTAGVGGGIFSYYSTSTVTSSTITGNNGIFFAGGIRVVGTGSMTLTSTIVAGNLRGAARDDISGTVTANYTLVGDNSGATINTTEGGNLIGTAGAPINPLLGPLANNLGPTKTHKLLAGSPAIDTGRPGFMPSPSYDQRGTPFDRRVDGDGIGGARIDIGAYELQPDPPASYGDFSKDGVTDAGDYTLWRKSIGTNVSPYTGADANGNGVIDQDDFFIWAAHFGQMTPPPGSGSGASVNQVAEIPTVADESVAENSAPNSLPQSTITSAEPSVTDVRQSGRRIAGFGLAATSSLAQTSESRKSSIERRVPKLAHVTTTNSLRCDDALVAWLASHMADPRSLEDVNDGRAIQDEPGGEASTSLFKTVDVAFDELLSEA